MVATKKSRKAKSIQLTKLKNLSGFMDVLVQIDLAQKRKLKKLTK